MAPRPAKRQRRATVVLSDDDEEIETTSSPITKKSAQREITLDGRTSQHASPAKKVKTRSATKLALSKVSPGSSPEKGRKNSKVGKASEQSKSLHNFFGRATEEQRWNRKSATPDVDLGNGELDDAIEDDELSDETLQELGLKTNKTTSANALDRRKPAVTTVGNLKREDNAAPLPSSQRFMRGTTTIKDGHPVKLEEHNPTPIQSQRPWADRYGPADLDELVVHKKKVSDVQNWLQGKISGQNNQKLLVLKGPAGSGKTTTLDLLAKTMGLQQIHWHNPAVSDTGSGNSIALQFDEFLNRSGQFGGLAFEALTSPVANAQAPSQGRVLVIEEFPASINRSSSTLQSFRSVLLQFLARSKTVPSMAFRGKQPSDDDSPPVVMIISETLISSSTALTDSFTAHRLLGPEILNHPYVTTMEFNPVAPTFVTKALDLVTKKEARESRRRRMPGPAVIQRLAEMGDVRSAVNSLEFLCLRGDDGADWSGTIAAKGKSKRPSKDKDGIPLTEMEKNSLQLITQRETTLDMFHAAGKIVYNKREDPRVLDTRAEPPPKPPDHLMHLYTPKVSQVDIEALLNETGTDIQTFISTLHENYILSCHGDSFEECFDGCSYILSTSDVLNPESRPFRRTTATNPNSSTIQANLQAGSSDTLRQDEISFQVATRGLLFNLPFPVNRAGASIPGGKRGDTFKMFYPTSLRLWKPTEEMDSLIEMFIHGTDISDPQFARKRGGKDEDGVANWRSRTFTGSSAVNSGKPGANNEDEDGDGASSTPTPPRVYNSKAELTLETLPFAARIWAARNQHDTSIVSKITHFKPTAFLAASNAESDVDVGGDDSLDNDKPRVVNDAGSRIVPKTLDTTARGHVHAHGQSPSQAHAHAIRNTPQSASADVTMEEKLYISDDDIEDD